LNCFFVQSPYTYISAIIPICKNNSSRDILVSGYPLESSSVQNNYRFLCISEIQPRFGEKKNEKPIDQL